MQLTLWTYEGPPHIGAMRIATAMKGLHYVLHAPQGDTYADLLFTMIERRAQRPPVTYTTFQARDLGGDTAELFKTAALDAYERFKPQAMLVGASCTAELIQDDPGGLAAALNLPIPVVPLELPAYQRKENWGASETFYQLVRALARRMCKRRERSANGLLAAARDATCWALQRWAFATATTCAKCWTCCVSWKWKSTWWRRWTLRRTTLRAWATPTSTS
jgi:light-independent protochlorophyllide reductase subunit B